MILSRIDKAILNSYKQIVKGLGDYLGEGYELILYSLEDYEHSILTIINGELNARKTGGPITDLALSLLKKIQSGELQEDSITYFNRNTSGEPIKAVTNVIRGENDRIIGLLCINFYLNTPFTRVMGTFIPQHNSMQKIPVIENFSDTTDNIIIDAVQEAKIVVDNDKSILATEKNKKVVHLLQSKGIFNIKDSVVKVADMLHISKNTVYLHIRSSEKN